MVEKKQLEKLAKELAKGSKNRKISPHDNSALKVVCLAVMQASEKWTMALRNWKLALNRFTIEFNRRFQWS